MKKYKYQRLSKEEKKEVSSKFYETDQGKILKQRFKRILIYSIILILFGIYLLIDNYFNNGSIKEYIYGGMLVIFGIVFLIAKNYITMIKVNEFITKPKNTTRKK